MNDVLSSLFSRAYLSEHPSENESVKNSLSYK